jgi:hypothetical protein
LRVEDRHEQECQRHPERVEEQGRDVAKGVFYQDKSGSPDSDDEKQDEVGTQRSRHYVGNGT